MVLTLSVATVTIIALQAWLIVNKAVNWDEFWFYSQIHEAAHGTLAKPLQTFHVRLFAFLIHLPGDAITQITVARVAMLGCWCVSALAIKGIAERFVSTNAAWLAALAYLSGGFAFLHGAAFRTDPMLAALLMMALWLLLRARLDYHSIGLIAVLIAVAGMISIKAALYLPAFAGIAWLRWSETGRSREMLLRFGLIALLSCAAFALLHVTHSAGMVNVPESTSSATIRTSLDKMFSYGLFPQGALLIKQAGLAPMLSLVILVLPFVLGDLTLSRAERTALFCLTVPLASLLIYRNSAAYYYVFILPPVLVAASRAIEVLRLRIGTRALAILLTLNAAALAAIEARQTLPRQRMLLTEIDRLFPQPVSYFDFCAMVGRFPRHIDFLTPWGLERYREAGRPRFAEAMTHGPVPLLVVNHPVLQDALDGKTTAHGLLPKDAAALRDNYIQHWGPIWVAGKRLASGSGSREIEIGVPGRYILEGQPLEIDGKLLPSGSVVYLARGKHIVGPRSSIVTLRWNVDHRAPKEPFPAGPLFTDF